MSAAAGALVIVGASHAGVQLAASARERGFEEPIIVYGDETHLPYQRPPLSKGLLSGKTTPAQLPLRSERFFADHRIELRLGRRVDAIDLAAHSVSANAGASQRYGWLALATGARCRTLSVPGAGLEGVFDLRTLDDSLRIAEAAASGRRVCVIGGGFIGLEVAAALSGRGAEVVVVESRPHLLTRTFPPRMSAFIEAAHRAHGVELLTGADVQALRGTSSGRVDAVQLADGRQVECDRVVLGIGVQPKVELARQAGIAVDNGIVVDGSGRTSAPGVLAIGDVAHMALRDAEAHGATHARLESIQAANDGAKAAAALLVGRIEPVTAVPWFWSEQFDLKLQMAGLHGPGDEVVLRGDPADGRFSLFYLRRGALVAAHSVNRPAEHMLSRKLIAARTRLSPNQWADESFDLKAASATSPVSSSLESSR